MNNNPATIYDELYQLADGRRQVIVYYFELAETDGYVKSKSKLLKSLLIDFGYGKSSSISKIEDVMKLPNFAGWTHHTSKPLSSMSSTDWKNSEYKLLLLKLR